MEKILLVEDDGALREIAHKLLSGEGHEVIVVKNDIDFDLYLVNKFGSSVKNGKESNHKGHNTCPGRKCRGVRCRRSR